MSTDDVASPGALRRDDPLPAAGDSDRDDQSLLQLLALIELQLMALIDWNRTAEALGLTERDLPPDLWPEPWDLDVSFVRAVPQLQ